MPAYQLYYFPELSQQQINLIEAVKARAVEIENDLTTLKGIAIVDKFWLEQAEVQLKQGITNAIRAIAKPGAF